MKAEETAVRAHYGRGDEQGRLSDGHGHGQLEFTRTTETLARCLPPPRALIADIGGSPGRHALWLASLGYQVGHRDLMPSHVSQLPADAARVAEIGSRIYLKCPAGLDLIDEAERTGVFPPPHASAFTSSSHRPDDLRAQLTEAGLEVTDPVSDLDAWMADPAALPYVLEPCTE